jgi:hypothetical protein
MDEFSYLVILLSIVLGLGITQLLSSFGRWLEQRASFQTYTPSLLWAGTLLLVHVQTWWTMFGLRGHGSWTFLQFGTVLLQPVILYLLAILVLPTSNVSVVDLRSNYYRQRNWFFGLFLALLAVSLLKDVVLSGTLPSGSNIGFHLCFAVVAISALVTVRDTVHRWIAYASNALVLVYIGLLFARLQ